MITAAFNGSSLRAYLAPCALSLLVAIIAGFGDAGRATLGYERLAIASGQWWRLLSANLVHLGTYHAALNLLGLAALLVLCPERPSAMEWLRRLLLLSLGVTGGLYGLEPQIAHYVGLSGVMHGLFLLGLLPMVRGGDLIAAGCLAYLVGKLAWEITAGAALSDEQAIGGHVVTQAHLFGTLAGLAYALLVGAWGRMHRSITDTVPPEGEPPQ